MSEILVELYPTVEGTQAPRARYPFLLLLVFKCGAVLRKGAMGVGEDMAAEIFTEINKAEPCKLLDLPQSKVSQMEKVSRSLASLVRVVDVVVVVSFVTRIFIIIQNRL